MRTPLLRPDDRGLFCEAGGFHIDPWKPVERAVISHGHGDHARWGSGAYLGAAASVPILRRRLGEAAMIEGVPFGETVRIGEAAVVGAKEGSAHPRRVYSTPRRNSRNRSIWGR